MARMVVPGRDSEPEGFKRCTGCGEERPLDAFYPKKAGRRGVDSRCRTCRLASEASKRRAAGMPERVRYDDPNGFKTCRHCLHQLPVGAFDAYPRSRDGLKSWCRRCSNEANSERRKAATRVRAAAREALGPPPGFKRCARCEEVKPLESFHRYHRGRDGRMAACKDCERTRRGQGQRVEDLAPEGFKTCAGCGVVKPLEGFHPDRRGPRGASSRCRECRQAGDAIKRRAAGIPEVPRFDDPEGFKTCRRCRKCLPVDRFGSEPRNRDGLRSWCTPCGNERTLQWHRDNPAAMLRLKTMRRTAEAADGVTERDWRRLVSRYDGRCAYCGTATARPAADHVVPLVRGGRHTIGNLLPVCKRCNSSKGAQLLSEWRYGKRRRRAIDPLPRRPTTRGLP